MRLCEWNLCQLKDIKWVPALLVQSTSGSSAVPLFTESVWLPNPLLMETRKLAIGACANIWNASDCAAGVDVLDSGLTVACEKTSAHNTLVRACFPFRKGVHYWEVRVRVRVRAGTIGRQVSNHRCYPAQIRVRLGNGTNVAKHTLISCAPYHSFMHTLARCVAQERTPTIPTDASTGSGWRPTTPSAALCPSTMTRRSGGRSPGHPSHRRAALRACIRTHDARELLCSPNHSPCLGCLGKRCLNALSDMRCIPPALRGSQVWGIAFRHNRKLHDSSYQAYGSYSADATVFGVLADMDCGTLSFYVDGVSQGVAYTG